jgi:hypothetical protein
MKRIATILGVLLGVAVPLATAAPGEAHVAPAPHLSCGELDGHFTNFPAGPQSVTLHYSVDGIEQPPVTQTGTGPAFDTSVGYYNADAGSHVLSARFTWTTVENGSTVTGTSPIATTTIDRCPPPPRSVVQVPVPVPTPVPTPVVCTSHRVITHRVRQTVFGREVIDVRAMSPGYKTTVTKTNGRWVVSVDVRGEQFTGFNKNVRTRVVVKLGRRAGTTRPIARTGWWRTVYKADTCRSRRGAADQNDVSSREPLIPIPASAVSAALGR